MTNHNPVFTSSGATGAFGETANTTNSSTLHLLSGTLNFKDTDRNDTHTTGATLRAAAWSGGTLIPSASLTDLSTALTSSILDDSTGDGTGKVTWSFSAADSDFDFLAKNETLVLTYDVTITDNHGGTAKQTVTVTITGSDDKPVFNFAVAAAVTEQADQSLSFAPDTTHVALQFTDPDLDNVGHTATVIAASASGVTTGILPGFLGTAELLSFYHVDNVAKAAGSSDGTINTTFSAPDLAFDYLAAGEEINITYTVQLDDHAGGISTQNVVVTVTGTNDAPTFISGPESAHLTEDANVSPAGNLTAHGDLFFADLDLSDTHTVSTTVTAVRSGGGAIPLSDADLLAALSTTLEDSSGHALGEVDWDFALANGAVGFLSGGETLTLTYDITVTDPAHATATQTVTVTILGTNHAPVITSGPESASLTEFADRTASPDPNTTSPVPTGTLSFTDADVGDTHLVAVSVASADVTGAPFIPAATQTDLTTALATTLNDSTGTGSGGVDWTFSTADQDLDFLGATDTLTVVYDVAVKDATTSASQTVTVTIQGSNDPTLMTSGPEAGHLAELPDPHDPSAIDAATPDTSATLSFTDVDLSDTHNVVVSLFSADTTALFIPTTTLADLATALTTTLNDSTGSGAGGVDWSFSIADHDLDFLAAGDMLTVVYDVAVQDAFTSSSQTVTITITGVDDALIVNPVTAEMHDTALADAGSTTTFGNVIIEGGDNIGGVSDTLSITEVNGLAGNVNAFVAGAYGTLFLSASGFYSYQANSAVDALQVGDTATDQFTFTVDDGHGHSDSSTLTVNVTGADDAPTITTADTVGSMTEDLGPSTVVNGGFETGTLAGWSTSGSHIVADFSPIGGQFGTYTARLNATGASETLSQDVATTPGQHYTLTFFFAGDGDAGSNAFTATWDGVTLLALTNVTSGGFTEYTFDVVGNATLSTTSLQFTYNDDGTAMFVDEVSVNAPSGSGTETSDGTIHFADVETADTHTALFVPQSADYVGTFSLGPVTEGAGSGSVGWHFTVDNADIQFLAQGQTLTQVYTVLVTDDHGQSAVQDVTVAIHGTNDAPTATADTIITNVDTGGAVAIPDWALVANDSDPDTADTLGVDSVDAGSGGAAIHFGGNVIFFDDATLGGSFDYQATDGLAASAPATATVTNNPASATTLTGGSGNEIVIGSSGGETLDGGAGNDVLIGNGGTDVLTGGSGDDFFAFLQTTDGPDTITDFDNTTDHDVIAISASGFGGGLSAGMDVTAIFETSSDDQFASTDSRFHFDDANQTLYYSADGTTGIALVQVQAGVTLHAQDLHIV